MTAVGMPVPFAGLSAATVRRDWLEPGLDALALADILLNRLRHLTGTADQAVTDLSRTRFALLRDLVDLLHECGARAGSPDAATSNGARRASSTRV